VGVRVRLTNAFGTQPLTVGGASVSIQQQGATPRTGSLRELTFGGQTGVTIPAGEHLYSDYADLEVNPLTTLLVSVYVPNSTGPVTNHPFTTNTNFLASGNKALATAASSFATTPCWMMVDAVDIDDSGPGQWVGGAVVALGDSITDTASTKGDANHRWTDLAAGRYALLSSSPMMSVVNAGLGGNRLLADRPGQPYYGVAALSRLERDVFSQSGLTSVIVLLGTNDLGYGASAEAIVTGYREIISRSRARGLRVFGGTMPPMGGSAIWSADREETWHTVNTWIRGSDSFDGVIDFAAALADPANPARMAATYDSGDHLHPNDAGTAAMARVVPLRDLIDTVRPKR
jgi:lysophospholipase L1-like esterase